MQADHPNDKVQDKDVLTFDPTGGGADFIMHPKALTAWVSVGQVSVHISNRGGMVIVELYPYHHEACCTPLDTCTALQTAKEEADKDHESGQ